MEKTQGCIFRSKCQTYEEGEKSTKFFLGLEKKIAINGTIDMLKLEDDTEVNNYNDVLEEIKRFYKNLFSKKELDNSGNSLYLEGLGLPKISESQKTKLEIWVFSQLSRHNTPRACSRYHISNFYDT